MKKSALSLIVILSLIIGVLGGVGGTMLIDSKTTLTSAEEKDREVAKQNIMALLWTGGSAEAKALRYQAYNIAKDKLLENVKHAASEKTPAVILDIDETVLNNMPFQAQTVDGLDYSKGRGWKQWIEAAEAEPIEGALNFMRYARSHGVEVFLVTNRADDGKEATLENLRDLGFEIDKDHLYTEGASANKAPERRAISQEHEIVMLIGDNLNDMHAGFNDTSRKKRNNKVEKLHKQFGERYIVIPNAVYGEWERTIYDYGSSINKKKARHKALETMKNN